MTMIDTKPAVCIAGNLIGRNAGNVTTQGLVLAERLAADGYRVHAVSSHMNRFRRLVDIVSTIGRNRRESEVLIIEVYSGLAFVLADAASFAGKIFGMPSVMVLHGGNIPEFAPRYPRWFGRVLRRAGVIVAPSAFLADAVSRLGFEARVVPNVVDVAAYPHRLRDALAPKLLWMRSFHPIYNPRMALEAFAAVRRDFPGATLVMAGPDKGLGESIKQEAVRMGLGDAVGFPGFLDETAKLREFAAADIYLNTNRIDNMPVSVVEACAMGLPVVATNVGGIPHLLTHGRDGLLVGDGDAKAMAAAIRSLLADPELAARLSRNGRLLAEKSAWPAVRGAWEKIFDEILTRQGRPDRRSSSALVAQPDDK